MKLLDTRTAPNPRRVRIFLAEKGIEVPREEIDLAALAHRSAEFTAINPLQRVPVLVLDDASAIAESVAICRYFEELHPEPALFGEGALGRATVEMWQRRVEQGLFFHVTQAFRHLHPRMAGREVPQVEPWGEASREKVPAALEVLDRRLGESRFLAGDAYSIADITALVAVDFMRVLRMTAPPELSSLWRWHGEVSSRPSAAA